MNRGIEADQEVLLNHLQSINYYRLSGYLYSFRDGEEKYKKGTTIRQVLQIYDFDSKLRILVLEAIERIEIAMKTQIAYKFSLRYGPFAYKNPKNLPEMTETEHSIFLEKISAEKGRSREAFVQHFENKYGKYHDSLPIWMAVEIMTFGQALTLFNGLDQKIKNEIAQEFKMPFQVLQSWLLALNTIRNICAHHSRLWNRTLGNKPRIPKKKKYPQWHFPVSISNNKTFCILTIIKYLLNIISPHNKWAFRLQSLLEKSKAIPQKAMGFPENWEQCPIWLAPHTD